MRAAALLFAPMALAAPGELFETRVRPVIAAQCLGCHSSKNPASGLALDSKAGFERGGKRGALVIAGDPDGSLLMRALTRRDPQLAMPPGSRLPESALAGIREWIASGAVYPETAAVTRAGKHWAFEPVRDVQPPAGAAVNPVDGFLRAKLVEARLEQAPPASRRDLIRRVTFDLIGLPPTPAEVEAFVSDPSPDAWARVVRRLLASPHYGERQARHWFDLVRFAETNGHEFDFNKYEAWRYRDYVIRAFNTDLPYDRFLAEHIAGDLIPGPRLTPDGKQQDSILGSGLWGLQEERNGATDLEEVRSEMRDSKIDVFGKAFLGLTIACARCHDHKFDPVSNADYYALGGIIDSTRTTLGSVESPELARAVEAELAKVKPPAPSRAKLTLRDREELFDDFSDPALPLWHRTGSAFRGQSGAVLDSSRGASEQLTGILVSRSFVPKRKYIHVRVAGTKHQPVREVPSLLGVTIFAPGRYPKGVAGNGGRRFAWRTITLKEEVNQVCHLEIADRRRDAHLAVDAVVFSDHREPPGAEAADLPALAGASLAIPEEPFGRISYEDVPHDMRIHERGNHLALGAEVPRRFLSVLGGESGGGFRNGSGRLALARAMTDRANPLVARVMVNRIWQRHFGEGLVATVDNFGRMGETPSHPELLDWLAARFVESGWSVKRMHELMLLSEAYQLSAEQPAGAMEKDPRNRLLSHMPVRRLDAESIRDAILSVSGSLDRSVHARPVTPHVSDWQDGRGKPDEPGPADGAGRRSVYIEVRRNFLTPLLLAFDMPLPSATAGRRLVSQAPAQALVMMNNEFVSGEAQRWARRLESQFHDRRERLDAMYAAAFSRRPDDAERARVMRFVSEGGAWSEVAHVLLNAKEFIFTK